MFECPCMWWFEVRKCCARWRQRWFLTLPEGAARCVLWCQSGSEIEEKSIECSLRCMDSSPKTISLSCFLMRINSISNVENK